MNIYVPKIIYVYNETLKKEYTQNVSAFIGGIKGDNCSISFRDAENLLICTNEQLDCNQACVNGCLYFSSDEKRKQYIESKNERLKRLLGNINIGDVIYAYVADDKRKYQTDVKEILITEHGILLKESLFGQIICPLKYLDSNEPWNYNTLYFSSDEKREEWIKNNI